MRRLILVLGTGVVLHLTACTDLDPDPTPPEDPCDSSKWYLDLDGDGWGRAEDTFQACAQPLQYASQPGDCDDTDATIHPEALEICDYLDNDCDGYVDNGAQTTTVYLDADEDGFGDASSPLVVCYIQEGYVYNDEDCDDDDPSAYPGAGEIPCDGVDNNCDGSGGEAAQALLDGVEYADLATAIVMAGDGDTVYVCPGIHEVDEALISLSANEAIHMTAWSGDASDTALDGGGNHGILLLSGGDVTLSHLSFQNGERISPIGLEMHGGAIDSESNTTTISHCRFVGNVASHSGGAIWVNSAPGGATTASLFIEASEFYQNHSGPNFGDGGAIALGGSEAVDLAVADSTFVGNTASYGGGAISVGGWDNGSVTVESCLFEDNVAGYAGGAIDMGGWASSHLVVNESTFVGNHSLYEGGAINISPHGSIGVEIFSSVFRANSSMTSGGALAIHYGNDIDVLVQDSDIEDGQSARGGGIYISGLFSLMMEGGTCSANTAVNGGGGLWLRGGSSYEATLNGVELDGNTADYGGAIACAGADEHATITVTGGAITRSAGGGVWLYEGTMLLSDQVDWGSYLTDNNPHDVDTGAVVYDQFTTGETFTCEGDGYCY